MQLLIAEFDPQDQFVRRLDAGAADMRPGKWTLHDVYINAGQGATEFVEEMSYPTALTIGELENSLALPETVSFWELPRYARLL